MTVTEIIELINYILGNYGLLGLLLLIIIALLIFPEEVEIKVSKIYGWFSFLGTRVRRARVKHDIQGHINRSKRIFNSELKDVMPRGLIIKWTKDVTPESFFEEKNIIVRMKDYEEQSRNFAYAVNAFVKKGILPESHKYLKKNVKRAVEITSSKIIFKQNKRSGALHCFEQEIVDPEYSSNPEVKEICFITDSLESRGMFTRVLLNELQFFGKLLGVRTAVEEELDETEQYVLFLKEVATKERRIDVPTEFIGKKIRSKIILVALPGKNIIPYLQAVNYCMQSKIFSIYVLAIGPHVSKVEKMDSVLKSNEFLEKIFKHQYKVRYGDMPEDSNAICIHYRLK